MTLQRRIFYWLFGALTTIAIVVFGTFYLLTSRLLYAQTDKEIETHATAIVNIATQQMSLFTQQVLENSPGMMIVIGTVQGQIIASSLPDTESQQAMGNLIEKSAGIIQSVFVNKQVGTNNMRIGVFPAGQNTFVLVGHPTDVIDHALARLVYQLIFAIALIILFSLLLSTWITRAVMAPITTLTERLESVSDANLTVDVPQLATNDELGRLTKAFANMTGRIRASFDRERQLIGELAHELKTPLAVAKSKLDLAATKPRKKEEYVTAVTEAGKAIDRIGDTLSGMLDLAWASAEQPIGPKDKVRLDLLLTEALEVAEALAVEKKLKITKKIESEITVAGKRDKLFRVLINVLDNAVKYSNTGGKVAVSLTRDGDKAKLEISNTGPGIAEEDLPHIFEPYYRGKGAKKTRGTGLGLAIVKRIVEAHGGEVQVRLNSNFLIAFTISLNNYEQ